MDQKEYGPVSAEVVRRWIREGRANARTLARAEDRGVWTPLGEFPEFAADLAARLGPEPRPPGSDRPGRPLAEARASEPSPATGPSLAPAGGSEAAPPATSGLAVGSLVAGVLSLCTGFPALLGLPLSLAALRQIKRSRGRLRGQGLALAGLGTSAIGLVWLLMLVLGVIVPSAIRARQQAQQAACLHRLRQLGMAMRMYANDQSDRLALATNWCEALQSYSAGTEHFLCPAGVAADAAHFGYNRRLSGLESPLVNPRTVLFFEIDGGWNVSGGPEQALRKPRHQTLSVCYADGQVEAVAPQRVPELRWEP